MLAELKSLIWTDLFFYSLVDPRGLYRKIRSKKPETFALSFSIPIIVSLVLILSFAIIGEEGSFFYYKVTYGWIFLTIGLSFLSVIFSSIMDLVAQYSGFSGKSKETVALINFSFFPVSLILPLIYIFKSINFAPLFFHFFFLLLLFSWSSFNAIMGLSEMHEASVGRSLLIFIFPFIITAIVLFFLTLLLVILVIGLF